MSPSEPDLDQTLAALADPTRRVVVELLGEQPLKMSELAEAVQASWPAMSRHLKVLREAGLVEALADAGDARARIYRLRAAPFGELRGWLAEVERFWAGQLDAFAAHAEGRALAGNLEGAKEPAPRRRV